MFRTVELPEGLVGRLFLHSMPGQYEAYEDARQEIARCQIARVVCLASLAEVKAKSPSMHKLSGRLGSHGYKRCFLLPTTGFLKTVILSGISHAVSRLLFRAVSGCLSIAGRGLVGRECLPSVFSWRLV